MNSSKRQNITKSDLEALEKRLKASFVSKTEFKREIAKLATKEELEVVRKRLDEVASQVALNTTDIRELKQDLARVESTINAKLDVVLQTIDGLAGKIDRQQTENAAILHSLSRHDRQLDDHEHRIEKLEVRADLR
jgi:ribosomal protein L29